MNVAEPSDLVMSGSQAAVLRVLCGTTAGLSVREIARLSGVAPSRVSTVVRQASDRGLVTTERHRGTLICQLNRDHLAADAVIALVTMRSRMLELLSTEIGGWPIPVTHASLFGSAARGDGGVESDLDVLVVPSPKAAEDPEAWDEQLFETAQRVRRATGNSPAWLVLTRDDLMTAERNKEQILSELLRDAVTLAGDSFSQVARRTARSS